MDVKRWRLFLDSSVLISGTLSPSGASSAILDLAEANQLTILLSKGILIELDRVFERKFPHLIDGYREFIRNLSPIMVEDPTIEEIRKAEKIIADQADAVILAAVQKENIDYFVTLDTKHFHTHKVRQYLTAAVVTPGQFLKEFRSFYEKSG